MKKIIFIIIFSIIGIICVFFIAACLTYGRPNSIFVNIVGRNLDNFIEFDRTNKVLIEDFNYTIIYIKKNFIEMGPPETRTRGNYLVSHLTLRNMQNSSEEIIFTKKHGIDPGSINKVIVDKNNNRLFFTVEENISGSRGEYLYIYDLINMQIVNKILILDRANFQREDWLLSGAYISNEIFYEINGKMYFQINFNLDTVYYEGRKYISVCINTGEIEEISHDMYNNILEKLNVPEISFSYFQEDREIKFFVIYPFSDYLPANYKHKYNGIYIYDGINNIRISKLDIGYTSNRPIWLRRGEYVIFGSYLFDTSGRLAEIKLVDGDILAIF
jgi:hypothetical protein